jgi:hypothetical protein
MLSLLGHELAHPCQPQWTVCLSEILTELEDFEEFSIGSARRGTRDKDMDKQRLVPADCPRNVILLAIDNNVLEEYCLAVKRQAIGSCCGIQMAVNGCEGVLEADLSGEEVVCVR